MTPFLPHIAGMAGYLPGEQPADGEYIKLNTNENPYPPSPLVLARLRAAAGGGLRRYPDAEASGVRRRLAALFGFGEEHFVVGNGSDELLNIAVRCFAGAGDPVAFATPTYPYYAKLVELQDARPAAIEFDDAFSLPPALAAAGAPLTLVPNPNSPSGTAVSGEDLEALASELSGILVIDEAYVDFARDGALDLVRRHANVIVARTLSKSFSLAGLRVGFCAADPELARGLGKVKEHYNVNALGQAAAEAALDDIDWMRRNARRVVATRARLTGALRGHGCHVWDSEANFVLARLPRGVDAGTVAGELRRRRILVRYFGGDPRLSDCLRISVGTDREIDRLLGELGGLLGKDGTPPGAALAPGAGLAHPLQHVDLRHPESDATGDLGR